MSCIEGKHDWCYSNQMLTSYPPQRDRICRKCGKKERITLEGYAPPREYEDLVEKFGKK